jgi:hypothetical protein
MTFTTYDQKPVDPCNDPDLVYYTQAQYDAAKCDSSSSHSQVEIGIYFNDVWAYKLCDQHNASSQTTVKSERYFDTQCEGSGWENWHPGAKQGGCLIELGTLVSLMVSIRYTISNI